MFDDDGDGGLKEPPCSFEEREKSPTSYCGYCCCCYHYSRTSSSFHLQEEILGKFHLMQDSGSSIIGKQII